jgi:hypothetical protein
MMPTREPATAAVFPHEQATTLTKLAGLLASLPAAKTYGTDELSATKHELEWLSACLERWSPDTTLRLDLQSIIKSLPSKAIESDEKRDAGYDLINHDSSKDGVLFDGEWPRLVTEPEDLERQASHLTGIEAAFLHGPCNLQDPTPHFKNNSHLRKFGKHDKRCAGKDPSGGSAWEREDTKITGTPIAELGSHEISKGKNGSRATVVRYTDEDVKRD